jgi:signal peptidase II
VTLFRKFFSPLTITAVFFLDRLTKSWIQSRFTMGESRDVLPFFSLTYLENTGAAFSLGHGRNAVLTWVTALILVALLVMRRRYEKADPENFFLKLGFAMVIGGALGNLYDRIALGSVVDFLDFYVGRFHWPAFNAADSCICVGAALLIFSQKEPK